MSPSQRKFVLGLSVLGLLIVGSLYIYLFLMFRASQPAPLAPIQAKWGYSPTQNSEIVNHSGTGEFAERPKFISIAAASSSLFALDENGTVWQYDFKNEKWVASRATREDVR